MKIIKLWSMICILLLALLLGSCAPKSSVSVPTPAPLPYSVGMEGGRGDTGAGVSPVSNEERMIVRTAELSLVVKDTEESVAQIKGIVSTLGGYVVNVRLWRDQDQLRGSITVRVPAEALDEALSRFKGIAVKVERESGSSQDVTEEYSDLSAQLRNLEATEQELLELLRTVREKTGKAEDILAVHRELTQIRGQIEQLKGRMQYLERTSAMSAVTIELIPDVLARPIAGTGWRPSETVAGALRALVQTLRFLVDAVIWIILYILPVACLVLLPFVALWLFWRRRRSRKLPAGSSPNSTPLDKSL
ncbi:MAG: DUF4349 domain-containing protein [Chloroflexi bacterium]|nr:DUF4349 domain-containing protein [Chloroflexota bacterium]